MRLQSQQCTGEWFDIEESRIDEFLNNCVQYDRTVANRDEAIAALEAGRELRNWPEDWYSKCRLAPTHEAPPVPEPAKNLRDLYDDNCW